MNQIKAKLILEKQLSTVKGGKSIVYGSSVTIGSPVTINSVTKSLLHMAKK